MIVNSALRCVRNLSIQLVSDLHVDVNFDMIPEISTSADVLVIAGDMGSLKKLDSTKLVLEKFSSEFETVLYVPGNHEYFYGELHEVNDMLEQLCSEFENIFLLNDDPIQVQGCNFYGSTMWGSINPSQATDIERIVSDYSFVAVEDKITSQKRMINAVDVTNLHNASFHKLKVYLDDLKENGESAVVITHHAPLTEGCCPPGKEGSIIASAFCNDFSSIFEEYSDEMECFLFGHTHYCIPADDPLIIEGVPIYSNALGFLKKNENTGFDPNFCITIN